MSRVRRRVIIEGHVQGIFFRDTMRRRAEQGGVAGWVTNRADGAVEALFEGDSEAVEVLIRFCHQGPRGARVDRVQVITEEPQGDSGFTVR